MIEIPGFKQIEIQHIVLDYNGTIAEDGRLLSSVAPLVRELVQKFQIHVITADTFGSVQREVDGLGVQVRVLSSSDHTQEKAEYVKSLSAEHCVAIGNGNNDAAMLATAGISIAVLGSEGLSIKALTSANLVVKDIADALQLFLNEKRLIATLRQ